MLYFYDKQEGQIINVGCFNSLQKAQVRRNGRLQWCYLVRQGKFDKTYPCNRYEIYMIGNR